MVAASKSNDFNDLARTAATAPAAAPAGQRPHVDADGHGADAGNSADVRVNPLKNKAEDGEGTAGAEFPYSRRAEKREVHLSARRIRELADVHLNDAVTMLVETGETDRVALEGRLRETLAAEGVSPETIEAELARIMVVMETF